MIQIRLPSPTPPLSNVRNHVRLFVVPGALYVDAAVLEVEHEARRGYPEHAVHVHLVVREHAPAAPQSRDVLPHEAGAHALVVKGRPEQVPAVSAS